MHAPRAGRTADVAERLLKVDVPAQTLLALRQQRLLTGMPVSAIVAAALDHYLDRMQADSGLGDPRAGR